MGSMTYSKIGFRSATQDRSSHALSGISTTIGVKTGPVGGSCWPGGGSSWPGGSPGPPTLGVIVRVPALTGTAFKTVRVTRRQTMVSMLKNSFFISSLLHQRVANIVIQLNKHVNRGIVVDNIINALWQAPGLELATPWKEFLANL